MPRGLGLVAAYLGPLWALGIYLLNLLIVVLLGNVLARTMVGTSPGLILEIPQLQLPQMKTLAAKTWLTLKEFITIAWPLLVGSSIILGLLEWADAADTINALLAPLTVGLLGLPALGLPASASVRVPLMRLWPYRPVPPALPRGWWRLHACGGRGDSP